MRRVSTHQVDSGERLDGINAGTSPPTDCQRPVHAATYVHAARRESTKAPDEVGEHHLAAMSITTPPVTVASVVRSERKTERGCPADAQTEQYRPISESISVGIGFG